MKKTRSNYKINIICDDNVINSLLQIYLNSNSFKITEKNSEKYYRAGDAMMGYKGFKYSYDGQILNIEAWLDGVFGNFSLEQNSLNILAMSYKNSLNILFQEINKINNGGTLMNNTNMNFDPNTGMPLNNQNNANMNFDPNTGLPLNNQNANNANQFAQKFQSENNKKKETVCEIGFWLSIAGVLLSLLGASMGLILYILIFYFASQGLNTRKKGKAIASIVLSSISILIVIINIVLV